MGLLRHPSGALWAGFAIAGVIFGLWYSASFSDLLGLASFLLRFVHIGAAMLWVGMIWFVNFIQLVALKETDDPGRAAIMRSIVPRVAGVFRAASHVVVGSGAGLLLTTGYLFDRWVFPSAVYIPSVRGAMMWAGTLAAIAMWALVHMVIWPNLRVILDNSDEPAAVAAARERVLLAARLNLVLAVPVTFAMVAAAHLY
jgi:uncharacterized membrane protein